MPLLEILTKSLEKGHFEAYKVDKIMSERIYKLYLESLDYHFGFSFNEESKFHSWEAVFKNPIHPINSAILIDNFLWGKLENFNEDNVENFYVIFEKLIPKTLKVPFYLSIIISNKDNRLNPKNAQEKINKVSNYTYGEDFDNITYEAFVTHMLKYDVYKYKTARY